MLNLLTTAQAAKRLGVSVRRVQKLVSEGRIYAMIFGRAYLFTEHDLKRFKRLPQGWKKGRKRG